MDYKIILSKGIAFQVATAQTIEIKSAFDHPEAQLNSVEASRTAADLSALTLDHATRVLEDLISGYLENGHQIIHK